MIKLSKTSKLDGIPSWSLQALETCPGSFDSDNNLVAACQGCYATYGNYSLPNVKRVRHHNREAWQEPEWVDHMIRALDEHRYFRWFDSGDVYAIALAHKILEVMRATPRTAHWLPTRMHKFPKFERVLQQMELLPNVVVRRSSDSVTGEYEPGVHGSTIIPSIDQVPEGVTACGSSLNGGRCAGCRACWSKDVAVIGYVAHGPRMKRVLREAQSAG